MRKEGSEIKLFLSGDVMLGRGIDQILPCPGNPEIHEQYLEDARQYVRLAEEVNGSIALPASFGYPWGDALGELERANPAFRLINLETCVTTSDSYWPEKEVHYRMNPANIEVLTEARIDCCAIANNHALDWGYSGLAETLKTLHEANITTAGAGSNLLEAEEPAMLNFKNRGRLIIYSLGSRTSGVPPTWAALPDRAGIDLMDETNAIAGKRIAERVRQEKQPGDIVVVSVHWGSNWGYDIPRAQMEFAHGLIDHAQVDVIHGHSSHHVKALEVYRNHLILYGCGDFINDYEGISGYELFRADLGLIYLPILSRETGELVRLDMIPTQIRRLRVNRAGKDEAAWLFEMLNRESKKFSSSVDLQPDNTLALKWEPDRLKESSQFIN